MRTPAPAPLVWRSPTTVHYDPQVMLTRTRAWSTVEVPLVPYAFAPFEQRRELAWLSTLSLAGLSKGGVRFQTIHMPTSPDAVARARMDYARRTGDPSPHLPELLELERRRAWQVESSRKRVFLTTELGPRRISDQMAGWRRKGPVPPVGKAELDRWHAKAADRLALLARGGYRAVPVDLPTLTALRRGALWRTFVPPPSKAGRRWWDRADCVDEFADLELTPLRRCVRVDTPTGCVYTATFVLSTFPVEFDVPRDTEPWLAHLDGLPFPASSDLRIDLVPPAKARRDLGRRLTLARGQQREAHEAGVELPLETEQILAMGRELEFDIRRTRQPWAAGWARVRVDAASEAGVAGMFAEVKDHMGSVGMEGIDVAWPAGKAQLDLLLEAVPGEPVRHRSYRQTWKLSAAACALPHAASGLGDDVSAYCGMTTGRMLRAVRWSPHTGIEYRAPDGRAAPRPGGTLLLGLAGAGKTTALSMMVFDKTMLGHDVVVLDASGPMARIALHPWIRDRCRVFNLTSDAAGGLCDPLGPYVIPDPPPMDDPVAYARELRLVQVRRARLTRLFLSMLLRRQLDSSAHPDAETELLRAIATATTRVGPGTSLPRLVDDLAASKDRDARYLGEHLRFISDDPDLAMAFGRSSLSEREAQVRARATTSILTMPGIVLPRPGVPVEEWDVSEATGAAMAALGQAFARRLLWDTERRHGLLVVDEAHVLLAFPAGRRDIEFTLRDGRKRNKACALATHNAVDVTDPRLLAQCSTILLHRTDVEEDLALALPAMGREDTPANRRQVRSLNNGECLARFPDGASDRMQWDREWIPGLVPLVATDAHADMAELEADAGTGAGT